MKKILAVLLLLLVVGCGEVKDTDASKFKKEYESLNGQINEHNNKEYVNMTVDEKTPFVYIEVDEVIKKLKKGTSVIYFGFPECPWCRNLVPVLVDAANELGVDKIYYYNAVKIRDTKELDENGNVVTTNEGTKEYKEIVDILYDHLPVYSGLEDETIKRLYLPTVVFIKDGKVIYLHTGTLESQEDPYVKLTKKQYNQLKKILSDNLNNVFEIVCDDAC